MGKTFWQVVRIIDLACVGDHAYYEVTMPLPPYPWITCLLQDMTAPAFHKGNSCSCSVSIAFWCVFCLLCIGRVAEWMNFELLFYSKHAVRQSALPGAVLGSYQTFMFCMVGKCVVWLRLFEQTILCGCEVCSLPEGKRRTNQELQFCWLN